MKGLSGQMRALANALDLLFRQKTDQEIEALLDGRAFLDIKLRKLEGDNHSIINKMRDHGKIEENTAIDSILESASLAPTREDARKILLDAKLLRKEYELLMRKLKLPIRKSDNIERMVDRLIDATVGVRLNSKAIRGE